MGRIYISLMKNKKKLIIIVGILLIVFIWVMGFVNQVVEGKDSIYATDPSINPFVCFASFFSKNGLFYILAFFAAVGAILFFGKMKSEEDGLKDERNFSKSTQGSYGTSGWMTVTELKEVLELHNIDKLDGDSGTVLGVVDGKAVTLPIKSRLNKHTAIYGASGTGKSRCFVRPQILQCSQRGESIIITDPKGEIYADTALFLKNEGYNVKVFNLVDPQYSDSWNCLLEVCRNPDQVELMAQTFAEVVIKNTMQGGKADHFWDNAEMNLLKALVLLIACDENKTDDEKTIGAAYALLTTVDEKQLNNMFERLSASHPAKQPYGIFKQSSESVRGNVIVGLGSRLQVFQSDIIRKITTFDEINLEAPAVEKSAYFVIMSDQDSTLDFLSSLFFSFLFIRLVRWADVKGNGRCRVPVNFILDEFPNIGSIPDFTKKLSTIRSRELRVAVIFQNIAQLQNRYPMGLWEEIVGNCDTQLFLGCTDQMTSKFISERTGEMTIEVTSKSLPRKAFAMSQMAADYRESQSVGKRVLLTPDEVLRLPNSNALVIIRGQKVLKVDKFDYSLHPHKDKFTYQNIREHVPDWKKNEAGAQFSLNSAVGQSQDADGVLDMHKDADTNNDNQDNNNNNSFFSGFANGDVEPRRKRTTMFSQGQPQKQTSQFATRRKPSQFGRSGSQFASSPQRQNQFGGRNNSPNIATPEPIRPSVQNTETVGQGTTIPKTVKVPAQQNTSTRPTRIETVSIDDF